MTMQTFTPAVSPFARDPFYATGVADAYDEHQAGDNIHTLKARAEQMLDTPSDGREAIDLYVVGYANTVIGLLNTHIAQTNAQADVAQTWLARKQGRETSTLHQRYMQRRPA
ncbi:hypothetical protein [Streptomyces sp. NPDC058985]|uniref:hypothetical protein n=1 Tax=Streptomyces sp. NPDC058985 TaxID=3346684 RepID=UPI00368BF2F7